MVPVTVHSTQTVPGAMAIVYQGLGCHMANWIHLMEFNYEIHSNYMPWGGRLAVYVARFGFKNYLCDLPTVAE